ncbi:uncharacterized protein ARMOST_06190 [Armillaria ostoyae]|uniref:Uncharacterized protein n=1 Tax=Armillaria ostoyae TaxID=47428 RepID=A0A284R2A6_ARMOS|nr:uncharacterized protein ARMOST_06190 [Armillaria ostoyae]
MVFFLPILWALRPLFSMVAGCITAKQLWAKIVNQAEDPEAVYPCEINVSPSFKEHLTSAGIESRKPRTISLVRLWEFQLLIDYSRTVHRHMCINVEPAQSYQNLRSSSK